MFEDDLVKLLVDAGVGLFGTNIFVSSAVTIPTGDGPFLSVIATGGQPPDRTHNQIQPPAYVRPGAQIVTRAKTYVAAKNMAQAAAAALNVRNVEINSVWYREVSTRQQPFDMGLDSEKRVRVAFNVLADSSGS
jgi:hypothetical protein